MLSKTSTKKFIFLAMAIALPLISLFTLKKYANLSFEVKVQDFLPKDHELIKNQTKILNSFNAQNIDELWVLRLKNNSSWLNNGKINKLSKITDHLEQDLGLAVVGSLDRFQLSIADSGNFQFEALKTVKLDKNIKAYLKKSSLSSPRLLSSNEKYTNIYFENQSNQKMDKLVQKVYKQIEKFEDVKVDSLLSQSLLQGEITKSLSKESGLFFLLSLAILVILNFAMYRNALLSFLSILNFFLSASLSCLAISLLKIPQNSLSVSIPILIMIMQISLYSHLVPGLTSTKDSFLNLLKNNKLGIGMSIGTTFIGFASLAVGAAPALQNYAYSSCLAILLSSVSILVYLRLVKSLSISIKSSESKALPEILDRLEFLFVTKAFRRSILIVGFLSIVAGSMIVPFNQYYNNAAKLLPENSTYFKKMDQFQNSVSGKNQLELVLDAKKENFWTQTKNMHKLEKLIAKINSNSSVIAVSSYLDYLQSITLNHKLPKSKEETSELLFLLQMMGIEQLSQFKNADNSSLRLKIDFKSREPKKLLQLSNSFSNLIKESFPGVKLVSTGSAILHSELKAEVSKNLIFGFYFSMLIISVLLALFWKSIKLSLIALLPNLIPVSSVILFMKISNWGIDPGTGIAFSIALGLSYDNSIFLLQNLKDKISYEDFLEIWKKKVLDISISSICLVAAFSVFFFSDIQINFRFACLMILASTTAYLADALFLPSLLGLFLPRNLDIQEKREENVVALKLTDRRIVDKSEVSSEEKIAC